MINKDLILTINPGTTTTRPGLFQPADLAVKCVVETTIEHDEIRMATFAAISDQLQFRQKAISNFLSEISSGVTLAAEVC